MHPLKPSCVRVPPDLSTRYTTATSVKHRQNTLLNGNRGSLCAIADLEFLQDPVDMVTHGKLANSKRLTDRLISKPLGEQLQDLYFPRTEAIALFALQKALFDPLGKMGIPCVHCLDGGNNLISGC